MRAELVVPGCDFMGRRTPIGNFIHTTWGNLNTRAANGKHRQNNSKNSCYGNIYIRFSREEFKERCLNNKEYILSLERPSLDRKDSGKDYNLRHPNK